MLPVLDDDLIAAMRRGERAVIAAALAGTPMLYAAVDDDGMTLLHWAVAAEQSEMVAELLAHPSVPLDAPQRSHGRTPLHLAAIKGHPALVKLLVEAGANVFANDTRGLRPLDVAGTPAAIAALRTPTLYPAESLRQAIRVGAVLRVRRQLAALPELCVTGDDEGSTALHWAVETDNLSMVEAVLAAGAPVMQKDLMGRTALHEAARRGNAMLCRALLAVGAQPSAPDYQGVTPLHIAAGHGDATRPLAPLPPAGLTTEAASPTARAGQCAFDFDALDPSPIALKAPAISTDIPSRDDLGVATMLLDAGAKIDTPIRGGVTILHLAADLGDAGMVSLLLAHGATPDPELALWRATPLHLAAAHGHLPVIDLLRAAGANINARDGYGRTAEDILNQW